MDDRLARIEAGLERLVPRGLSDSGAEALEAKIDELADLVPATPIRNGVWRRGIAAAAAVALLSGVAWWQQAGDDALPRMVQVPAVPAGMETVSAALQVNERFDGGWVHGDGSGTPYRYHGYEVTDQQELVDEETGYQIEVRERREEWIPVKMTSL